MKCFSFSLFNSLQDRLIYLHYLRRWFGEYLNVYKKRNLVRKVNLSAEQKHAIDELWKNNFGRKIPYFWHRLYASYTGHFDENYFPEIFYSTNLEKKYNDFQTALVIEDKSNLDIVLRDCKTGESNTVPSIIYSHSGLLFNCYHEQITEEEAISLLGLGGGKFVIKPSIDTDSGRGVKIFDIQNGIDVRSNLCVKDILKSYKTDFLVQRFIKTHKTLESLNPTSVNTIRIITYFCDGRIYHCPLAMRIGSCGSEVDNIHAGGFVIGLQDNGYLNEYAFTEYGEKYSVHPKTKIVFSNYRIPGIKEAIELVERKHQLIPRLTFISWDVSIDENGNPIIIEMNTRNQSAWFPQMVNGMSLFGENTSKMIQSLKNEYIYK